MAALRQHFRKVVLFAILSSLDLFFTWQLLVMTNGKIYESNPVASIWLEDYGWLGLAAYKTAMVLLVIATTLIISRYRPRTSNWILNFGCIVTAAIVGYGFYLTRYLERHQYEFWADEIKVIDDQYFQRHFMLDREERLGRQQIVMQLGVHLPSAPSTLAGAFSKLALWEIQKRADNALLHTSPRQNTDLQMAQVVGPVATLPGHDEAVPTFTQADELPPKLARMLNLWGTRRGYSVRSDN